MTMTTKQRNREVQRLVREFLLNKRFELARSVNDNRRQLRKLADDQRKFKGMLADINRQIDELGIRIKE